MQLELFAYLPLQPRGGPRGALAPVDRMWHRIEARVTVVTRVPDLGACWECGYALEGEGYPVMTFHGVQYRCSRIAFQRHNGALRDGSAVRHRCHNRRCVRPEHLEHGDAWQNAVDMRVSGRSFPGRMVRPVTPCEVIYARTARGSQQAVAAFLGRNRSTVIALRLRRTHRHVLVFREDVP